MLCVAKFITRGRMFVGKETIMRLSESFKEGFGRSVRIVGSRKKSNHIDPRRDDVKALRGDWINVGRFISKGISEFRSSKG